MSELPGQTTLEIRTTLTEAQYMHIHALLDRDPNRYKGWPERYVFSDFSERINRVTEYLRHENIPHLVSTTVLWEPRHEGAHNEQTD